MNNWRLLITSFIMAVGALCIGPAAAENYPARPIKLVVPWPAGGATDSLARVVARKLGEVLGQPVVVENKPGANGQIGMLSVARAEPDGHTLALAAMTSHAIAPAGSRNLPYDVLMDFVHVGTIAAAPMLLVVPATSQITSLSDLIARAKAEPGNLTYASYGIGSAPHLAAELLAQITDIQLLHVPYQGTAPAAQALLAGQVSLYFDSLPSGLPLVKAERAKALAITSHARRPDLPDVPTVAETIPGFEEIILWWGLSAPKGTDPTVVRTLNEALATALADPLVKEQLAHFGAQPYISTSSEFTAYIKREIQRWAEVMQKGNISLN